MSAYKLDTLKQKLWAIVAASIVARVIIFFVLPPSASSIQIDEINYAALSKWIAEGKDYNSYPNYPTLYLTSRTLILPASKLVVLGINELDAVRIISSVYGVLCAILILSLLLGITAQKKQSQNPKYNLLIITLFATYSFLPSHFIWSVVGIKESANEFWLISTFVGVFLLDKVKQSRRPLVAALIAISIICTFSSRPQVGWVLVATLLVFSVFKLRNSLTYLLITSVFIGLIVGYLVTTSYISVTSDVYEAKNPSTTSSNASKLCDGKNLKVEYEGKIYDCVKTRTVTERVRSSNLADVAIDQIQVLPGQQIVNQIGAASAIERLSCPWEESSRLGRYGCLAYRAPYMTLTFLFRPLPLIDHTSLASMFAAAENMFWILMFLLIAHRIIKLKRIPFIGQIGPAVIFLSLYSVAAGSYEGNMGTAFRHKSLILWTILCLLLALFWRNDADAKVSKRNNSQESAV